MPDFDLPAHCGLSYGREELLRLRSGDVTLPRPVRKAIFSHGLWLPRHQRNPRQCGEHKQQLTATTKNATRPPSVNYSTLPRTPSSTSVKFGLLNARSVGNKFENIASLIAEDSYDVFLVTETWHTTTDDVALRRCIRRFLVRRSTAADEQHDNSQPRRRRSRGL